MKKLSKAAPKSTQSETLKPAAGLFSGMVFAFAGTHKLSHKGLSALVTKHEGSVSPNMGLHVTHLISSPSTFLEAPGAILYLLLFILKGKVRFALKHGISILEEDFIHDCISKNTLLDQSVLLFPLSFSSLIISCIYWGEQ